MNLNDRIKELENKIISLESKIQDLSKNTEEKNKKPYTVLGGQTNKSLINPFDLTSKSSMYGGSIFWNDSEVGSPNQSQPSNPTKGYHKHSHSRYSGGALIKDVLEVVEFDWGIITNKHSQQFLTTQPSIATEINSKGETVEKIGLLDLVFNPDTQTWGVAALEIDVKKCYLVMKDENGDIELDEKGQEIRAPLWNEDTNKTSIVWDSNGKCFRLYAVYSPGND
jgi:hypothetical protein